MTWPEGHPEMWAAQTEETIAEGGEVEGLAGQEESRAP